jgi:hypothetical protein
MMPRTKSLKPRTSIKTQNRTSKKKKKKKAKAAAMMKIHLTTALITSSNVSRMHTVNIHRKKVNLASFFWVQIAV